MRMMMLVSMDKDLFKCWGTLKIHGVERLLGSFFFRGEVFGVWVSWLEGKGVEWGESL